VPCVFFCSSCFPGYLYIKDKNRCIFGITCPVGYTKISETGSCEVPVSGKLAIQKVYLPSLTVMGEQPSSK